MPWFFNSSGFADNEAQPLNGARIHITGENTDINETTDISGKPEKYL